MQKNIPIAVLAALWSILTFIDLPDVHAQNRIPNRNTAARDSITNSGENSRQLTDTIFAIEEVAINTGFQRLPKERTTGSFVVIDSADFNRTYSTDVLSRLDGMVSGLRFNRNPDNPSTVNMSLRGASTLTLNDQPLIILDNFEYTGDIRNINPNDVASITVLKDASASSIWGAKAGNGVIVITSKTGNYNRRTQVSYNTNLAIQERPDLYNQPRLNSADYIALEIDLFERGYYTNTLRNINKPAVTPVVWLMEQRRLGLVDPETAAKTIAQYSAIDSRVGQQAYFFRKGLSQQHAFSMNGGGRQNHYHASVGWDRNLSNQVGAAYNRLSVNLNHTVGFFDNRLEIQSGAIYTRTLEDRNALNPIPGGNYPYAAYADAEGNPLPLHRYNPGLLDTAGNGLLLDWNYRPLDELKQADNTQSIVDMKFNLQASYRAAPWLRLQALYRYANGTRGTREHYSTQTYFARNLINEFSALAANGEVLRPVPLGGILDLYSNAYTAHNARLQANLQQHWGAHELNIMTGAELSGRETHTASSRYYGYHEDRPGSVHVDPINTFTSMVTGRKTIRIPTQQGLGHLSDRFLSFYANAGYHFNERYHLSASMRKDGSNLFGVRTNQRWNPLWSAGLKWMVDRESFFDLSWLPELSARATYGTSGNIDNSVSALLVARSFVNSTYGHPALSINTPPNPDLTWETIATLNTAIDFVLFRHKRIRGSVEYYWKHGQNLMGAAELAPSSGLLTYYGNTASMKGHGIDLTVHSLNSTGPVVWRSTLLYGYATNKVTEYRVTPSNNSSYVGGNAFEVGRPLQAMYAYRWAGLNPENGNPRGYLNGEVSEDYGAMVNSTDMGDLRFIGSAHAPHFGSLRNNLDWNGLSLSFMITLKTGHYFNKNLLNYGTLYGGAMLGGAAYYPHRWQAPGDEAHTHVPSMVYPAVAARDNFYTRSEVRTEKADFLRLQDIRLGYTLERGSARWIPAKNIQLFAMASNVALLWKAYQGGFDSDFGYLSSQIGYSGGLKLNF